MGAETVQMMASSVVRSRMLQNTRNVFSSRTATSSRLFSSSTSCQSATEPPVGKLSGKVAIVTASTDGIGFGIAQNLARHGAHVMLSSRKVGCQCYRGSGETTDRGAQCQRHSLPCGQAG